MEEDKNGGSENGSRVIAAPRLITIVGEITFETVEKVVETMAVYNAVSDEPIVVHITSPGGILDPALAIYDLFRLSRAPVITCVFGCAGSSASIIAQAGAKRFMAPNANMMIHTGSLGLDGRFKGKDLQSLAKDAHRNNDHVFRIYAEHTGNGMRKIREWCEAETEMTPRQALERGFVDAILRFPGRKRRAKKPKRKTSQKTA